MNNLAQKYPRIPDDATERAGGYNLSGSRDPRCAPALHRHDRMPAQGINFEKAKLRLAWLEGHCNKRMLRGGTWDWSASMVRSGYRESALAERHRLFLPGGADAERAVTVVPAKRATSER